jgi:hypothetical protein
MSEAPYEKECMYCKTKIRMSKESGKWLPYNINNGPHDCRKKKEESEQETTTNNNTSDISLEVVLKKLASIGITLDLEKLRNCK